MADCHGPNAPLGLGSLAGIIDDERIDDGNITGQGFGPAIRGQGHRLAWQPLERPMCADMDQRMNALGMEPQVEGHIGMTRGACEVVVVVTPRLHIATLGLKSNGAVSAPERGKMKEASCDQRIAFDIPPGCEERFLKRRGKCRNSL